MEKRKGGNYVIDNVRCLCMFAPYFLQNKNKELIQNYKVLEIIISKENVRMTE